MKNHLSASLPERAMQSGILLADAIRVHRKMNAFLRMEDRSVQRILQELENGSLAIALLAASREVRDKLMSNCSQRLAKMLQEDMNFIGRVDFSEVEKHVDKVLEVTDKLCEAGEIKMGGGSGA